MSTHHLFASRKRKSTQIKKSQLKRSSSHSIAIAQLSIVSYAENELIDFDRSTRIRIALLPKQNNEPNVGEKASLNLRVEGTDLLAKISLTSCFMGGVEGDSPLGSSSTLWFLLDEIKTERFSNNLNFLDLYVGYSCFLDLSLQASFEWARAIRTFHFFFNCWAFCWDWANCL